VACVEFTTAVRCRAEYDIFGAVSSAEQMAGYDEKRFLQG
jgi:hypothetical protein